MLPAIPATFGRLSEVFASSLGAISGAGNSLGFRPAKRVIAILVDGLGAQNLKAAGGHAPFLNQALAQTKPISCGFPSTTATSITSFATGLAGGGHGLVGYKVFERQLGLSVNLLTGWNADVDPLVWQPNQTVTETAVAAGIAPFVIGPAAYAESGFTQATMRGAKYLSAKTIADRIDRAVALLQQQKDDFLAYLYIPELDQAAHGFGVASDRWLHQLEELDAQVKRLSQALGKTDALLLTADHGVVDVPKHRQLYIDEAAVDWSLAADVSGDPRVNFIYLHEPTLANDFAASLQDSLGDQALALTKQQVIDTGWYGPLGEPALVRMPDVFALATKQVALYHRNYAPAKSLEMIGQHGALSPAELSIPLLGWGAFGAAKG
ncbi:MAG: hypothetical protein RL508_579 [Actinomycetota bacterium]